MDMIGYNLYAYVSNNCINYADVNGQWSFSLKSVLQTIAALVDPLGSTRKINRNNSTIKQEQQQLSMVTNAIKEVAQSTIDNFVCEAGVGTGADLSISNHANIGFYQDVTHTYQDGKITSTIQQSRGATAFDIGPSKTKIREYPIKEKSCGYGFSPYSSYVMKCPEAYDTGISFGNQVTEISSDDSLFLGFSFGIHIVVGFHIKIGWEIDR